MMKIGIHHRKGSFSDQWIAYCEQNGLHFKVVDCYKNDIIQQLGDCDVFMWHYNQTTYQDMLFAKGLLFSLQQAGKKVFPDFNTGWHFDDKLCQKYLLEAVGAPLVKSYAFYDELSAISWANQTTFPKVFKLRGGSGAKNVKLIKSKKQAIDVIKIAFSTGFAPFNKLENLKDRLKKFIDRKESFSSVLKSAALFMRPSTFERMQNNEKGYVYFQDFMANNTFDIRLIVIQDRAYGMKRLTRKDDFRASGSSNFVYDAIPDDVLKVGFEVANKLKLQSVAFDFVYDNRGLPVIVEISYGFGTKGSRLCTGYWDDALNWHEGPFNPQGWMIDHLVTGK